MKEKILYSSAFVHSVRALRSFSCIQFFVSSPRSIKWRRVSTSSELSHLDTVNRNSLWAFEEVPTDIAAARVPGNNLRLPSLYSRIDRRPRTVVAIGQLYTYSAGEPVASNVDWNDSRGVVYSHSDPAMLEAERDLYERLLAKGFFHGGSALF